MTKKESASINYDLRTQIDEIRIDIEAIEKDASLFEERSFDRRIEAIDFIDFYIIDRVEELLKNTNQPDQLLLLKNCAGNVKAGLEAININLFKKLRASIGSGEYKGKKFKDLINEYMVFDLAGNEHEQDAGYDNLDLFINGLFSFQDVPEQTLDLEPEMVFYQKTPARIIFELAEKLHFTKYDVFFDLGSGLGQAAMLVNLLAGIRTIGIEFEPAFCNYARDCAAKLNLPNVSFVNIDARKADYSKGTIFFMYTPFKGKILQEVLGALKKESLRRDIKIITYGPCTAEVASQSWLQCAGAFNSSIYKLNVFSSLQD